MKKIIIFGKNEFITKSIVRTLADADNVITLVAKDTNAMLDVRTGISPGRIRMLQMDMRNSCPFEEHIKDQDIVINCSSILYTDNSADFFNVNTHAAENIAKAVKKFSISTFIHFSSLGIEDNKMSKYANTILRGESAVQEFCPNAIILRTSVVFGKNEGIIDLMLRILRFFKFVPAISYGKQMLQPVYAPDIAKLILNIITNNNTIGKIYNVCGKNIYTLDQIWDCAKRLYGKRVKKIKMPFFIVMFIVYVLNFRLIRLMLKPFTKTFCPLVTIEHLQLILHDNTSTNNIMLEKNIMMTDIRTFVDHEIKLINNKNC